MSGCAAIKHPKSRLVKQRFPVTTDGKTVGSRPSGSRERVVPRFQRSISTATTALEGNCFCARRTGNGQNGDRRRGVRGYVSPGMVFGEMAVIDGAPRAATIVADGEVECDALSVQAFEGLGGAYP
ncbi:MAG: cyclic nucleotide-binding domain-containing protein [Chthoniobacteraceae bacterium]